VDLGRDVAAAGADRDLQIALACKHGFGSG
jgi:hypothetical protein